MTPALRRKLEALLERREEVERLLADPAVAADQTRFRNLSREFSSLQPVADAWLPRARQLADAGLAPRQAAASHAQRRYQRRQARLQRLAAARRAHLAARAAAVVQTPGSSAKLNPADLIAKAMARAQAQQNQRTEATNQADFAQQQIDKAQARATYRRAQRDLRYGSEAEQAAALAWLRAYKAEQEQE